MESNKENRAIVLTYFGTELTKKAVSEISSIINKCTDCPAVRASTYDSTEIHDFIMCMTAKQIDKEVHEENPVEDACLLVGTVYYEWLSKGALREFSNKLLQDLTEAFYRKNNPALLNAIGILCTETIPSKYIKKYHLTNKVLSIIKFCNNIVNAN